MAKVKNVEKKIGILKDLMYELNLMGEISEAISRVYLNTIVKKHQGITGQ